MQHESFIKEVLKVKPLMIIPLVGMISCFVSFFICVFFTPFSFKFDTIPIVCGILLAGFFISAIVLGILNPFSSQEMKERFGVISGASSSRSDDNSTNPAYGYLSNNVFHSSYIDRQSSSFK